jgi:integrase
MSILESSPFPPPVRWEDQPVLDDAELAAAAFLARYSGRTLDSYRADLREFFQWAHDVGVAPLDATRAHIELYRSSLVDRGLAPSTIDRRSSTVCGYYRFAHIDGRITANPAQYVRRPRVHPTAQRGMDRGELANFLYAAERTSPMHAALAVLLGLNGLRVSEACGANIDDLGFKATALCRSSARATSPLVSRSCRAQPARSTWRSANVPTVRSCCATTDNGSTRAPRTAGCAASASAPGSSGSTRTCSALRSSWLPSTLGFRCATSRSRPVTLTHGLPPSTTGDARTTTATPLTPWSRS